MSVLTVDNVNEAYFSGLRHILNSGESLPSRNGPVFKLKHALTTHYRYPNERMLFSPARDANPFFHLFESLWMLAGRDDVAFVEYYVKNMRNFSDDGERLNGAYGYRWRKAFNIDQLTLVTEELRTNPHSRRIVLQMWDSRLDLEYGMVGGKDACCNLLCKFSVDSNQRLNMHVVCRSNDMVLGGYGANAVHFSFLQEYLADRAGLDLGYYEQISLDSHMYTEALYGAKQWEGIKAELLSDAENLPSARSTNPYSLDPERALFTISPVLGRVRFGGGNVCDRLPNSDEDPERSIALFEEELPKILDFKFEGRYLHPYFENVVSPLMRAYFLWKEKKDFHGALECVEVVSQSARRCIPTTVAGSNNWCFDLGVACTEWLLRRKEKSR